MLLVGVANWDGDFDRATPNNGQALLLTPVRSGVRRRSGRRHGGCSESIGRPGETTAGFHYRPGTRRRSLRLRPARGRRQEPTNGQPSPATTGSGRNPRSGTTRQMGVVPPPPRSTGTNLFGHQPRADHPNRLEAGAKRANHSRIATACAATPAKWRRSRRSADRRLTQRLSG